MAAIPPRLQTDEHRFILLGSSGEDFKKAFETDCLKTANYRYDDPKLLNHLGRGGNYGVCGGYGDLHVIDCDDLSRWQEIGALDLIPATYTIESRPEHRQYYVRCKDHFKSGGLFDLEKFVINEENKPDVPMSVT